MELTQEQIDAVVEAYNKMIKIVKDIFEKLREIFSNFINSIFKKNRKEILKCCKIYRRTHNRRIKKKQLTKIYKLLI